MTLHDSTKSSFFKCLQDKEAWDRNAWIEEQSKDEDLKSVIKSVHANDNAHFILRDGLLLKLSHKDAIRKEKYEEQVVVPESLKAFVIGCHHNLPMHGHQGRKRTEYMISARYYWRGMNKDIRR